MKDRNARIEIDARQCATFRVARGLAAGKPSFASSRLLEAHPASALIVGMFCEPRDESTPTGAGGPQWCSIGHIVARLS